MCSHWKYCPWTMVASPFWRGFAFPSRRYYLTACATSLLYLVLHHTLLPLTQTGLHAVEFTTPLPPNNYQGPFSQLLPTSSELDSISFFIQLTTWNQIEPQIWRMYDFPENQLTVLEGAEHHITNPTYIRNTIVLHPDDYKISRPVVCKEVPPRSSMERSSNVNDPIHLMQSGHHSINIPSQEQYNVQT